MLTLELIAVSPLHACTSLKMFKCSSPLERLVAYKDAFSSHANSPGPSSALPMQSHSTKHTVPRVSCGT